MSVPETTMHQHDDSVLRKHDIGMPWQEFRIEPEPVTQPMKKRTYNSLGFGVLTPNARHVPASMRTWLVCFFHSLPSSADRKRLQRSVEQHTEVQHCRPAYTDLFSCLRKNSYRETSEF